MSAPPPSRRKGKTTTPRKGSATHPSPFWSGAAFLLLLLMGGVPFLSGIFLICTQVGSMYVNVRH